MSIDEKCALINAGHNPFTGRQIKDNGTVHRELQLLCNARNSSSEIQRLKAALKKRNVSRSFREAANELINKNEAEVKIPSTDKMDRRPQASPARKRPTEDTRRKAKGSVTFIKLANIEPFLKMYSKDSFMAMLREFTELQEATWPLRNCPELVECVRRILDAFLDDLAKGDKIDYSADIEKCITDDRNTCSNTDSGKTFLARLDAFKNALENLQQNAQQDAQPSQTWLNAVGNAAGKTLKFAFGVPSVAAIAALLLKQAPVSEWAYKNAQNYQTAKMTNINSEAHLGLQNLSQNWGTRAFALGKDPKGNKFAFDGKEITDNQHVVAPTVYVRNAAKDALHDQIFNLHVIARLNDEYVGQQLTVVEVDSIPPSINAKEIAKSVSLLPYENELFDTADILVTDVNSDTFTLDDTVENTWASVKTIYNNARTFLHSIAIRKNNDNVIETTVKSVISHALGEVNNFYDIYPRQTTTASPAVAEDTFSLLMENTSDAEKCDFNILGTMEGWQLVWANTDTSTPEQVEAATKIMLYAHRGARRYEKLREKKGWQVMVKESIPKRSRGSVEKDLVTQNADNLNILEKYDIQMTNTYTKMTTLLGSEYVGELTFGFLWFMQSKIDSIEFAEKFNRITDRGEWTSVSIIKSYLKSRFLSPPVATTDAPETPVPLETVPPPAADWDGPTYGRAMQILTLLTRTPNRR